MRQLIHPYRQNLLQLPFKGLSKPFHLILILSFLIACEQNKATTLQHTHQPVISKPFVLDPDKCEAKTNYSSTAKTFTAVLEKSDLTQIPYDSSKANIYITSKTGDSFCITISAFKSCHIKWINDNLLYIDNQLGHAASLYSIYDCKNKKWLTRELVFFAQNH